MFELKTAWGLPIPILLFGSRNVELITGQKTTTIRKLWKKPLSPGDRLHCYWNLVSKERRKLFEAEVTSVEIVKFRDLIKMIPWPVRKVSKMLQNLKRSSGECTLIAQRMIHPSRL